MVALSLPRLEGSRRTRFIIGAAFGSVIILFILAWSHQLFDPTAAGLSAVASIPWSIFVVNTQPPYYGREAKWVKRTVRSACLPLSQDPVGLLFLPLI